MKANQRILTTACAALLACLPTSVATAQESIGQVMSEQEISDTSGGFAGGLTDNDYFGWAVCRIGDVDGDGNQDIAVGAEGDDDGFPGAGAVYILFLRADGTVRASQKISATSGGLVGPLGTGDAFGSALALLGDLNGDGFREVAVGAPTTDDGGTSRGAVWILSLDAAGVVVAEQKISDIAGGFAPPLSDHDWFGMSIAAVGDANGDTIPDMAVGAPRDGDGGPERGAVYLITLNAGGTVSGATKYSQSTPTFTGTLTDFGRFGYGLACAGDIDDNGMPDLAVGTPDSDEGGGDRGSVWVLQLRANTDVKANTRISSISGGFTGALADFDHFGRSVACIGDLDQNGVKDLLIGAEGDDDGGTDRGAAWVVMLSAAGTVIGQQEISQTAGNFSGPLADGDEFGRAMDVLGDPNGNGCIVVIVGAPRSDDGGTNRGSTWLLSIRPDVWTRIGPGLAGVGGVTPVLNGGGPLTDGTAAALHLTQARPLSTSVLIGGFSVAYAPLLGGTLVPSPDVVLFGFPTNAAGESLVTTLWPVGIPAGTKFYFQQWVMDPAAPFGFSASNGLLGIASGP